MSFGHGVWTRTLDNRTEEQQVVASAGSRASGFDANRRLRKPHRYLLALFVTSTASVGIPALVSMADPPKANTPSNRVQIRFPESPTQTAKTIGQERLTDVGRSTAIPDPTAAASQPPLNVATEQERNQRIAPDWKSPWMVFYITGNQYGYIEPCGCTGLANQKGGVSRKDRLLTTLRDRDWNVIPIDSGNQVRRDGKQSEIKFHWTAHALREMNYAAVAFGKEDLKLTFDSTLVSILDEGGSNQMFVSANVSLSPGFDLRYKTLSVKDNAGRPHTIGITSVFSDTYAKEINTQYITIEPAAKGLGRVTQSLTDAGCDFKVLLVQASLEETRSIVQQFPQYDLVVTSGGLGEPTFRPETLPGIKTQIVQAGTKGMYAGIVGLFDDATEPLRYQRIALSSQFEDSPRMMALFGKYQDELKAKSDGNFEMLGMRPSTHPTEREFVGSEKCGDCHTTAFDIWKNTPHFHATESIVEPPERTLARHFDPECISCHVTGWNPQKFQPYRTGWESLEASTHLAGSGCENCHGPGSSHVAAELGDVEADSEMLEALRAEMRLPLDQAQDKCLECHDIDNSPDFHDEGAFAKYWDRVKHYGKD